MGLWERVLHLDDPPKAPQFSDHQLIGLLGELQRGKTTLGQVATALNLDAGEQAELNAILARINPPLESISLGGYTVLTNVGTTYDANDTSQGLGVVRVEGFGITGFEFGVKVRKVGTGTQSWQLWNETDGVELAVLDDTGAVGIKNLSVINAVSTVSAGRRTLRVRCKSTVAADDPIYLGGSLLIRRVEQLTADIVQQVIGLGRTANSGYDSVAAIKARLGV